MKAHKLIFDQSTFGITGKSLKMLRNAICDNLRNKMIVAQVPTNDILCGFLVLNQTNGTATWSGDGFRTDRGGEGGRGYAAAIKMMETFCIHPNELYSEETKKAFHGALAIRTSDAELAKELLAACNKAAEEFDEEDYKSYYEITPWY